MDYRNFKIEKEEKIKFYIVGYMVFFIITYLFYKNFFISIIFGFFIIGFTKTYNQYVKNKRKKELLFQFKEFLAAISSSVESGRNAEFALIEAKNSMNMVFEKKPILVEELEDIIDLVINNNESEVELLQNFAERTDITDIIDFFQVYGFCRMTGGNIARVVNNASVILLDKLEIEREIEAATAQRILEAKIVVTMPFLILIVLNIVSPDYLEILYTTIEGKIIMTLSLLGIGYAIYLLKRIIKIQI